MRNIAWFPKTKTGKMAIGFIIFVIILGCLLIILNNVPHPASWDVYDTAEMTYDGGVVFGGLVESLTFYGILVSVIFLILAYIYSVKALFKVKDSSILGWICFGLVCLIILWLLYVLVGVYKASVSWNLEGDTPRLR